MCDFLSHREALHPFLSEKSLHEIVEDNSSCHNNEVIREEHRKHEVQLVGHHATDEEKITIKDLISQQVSVMGSNMSRV